MDGHASPHAHKPPSWQAPCTDSALLFTFVQRLGHLTGVPAPVGTTLLDPGALAVHLTTFHAGGGKATGFLGRRTIPLLDGQDVLEELTAGQAFVVLFGEQRLMEEKRKIPPSKTWNLKCPKPQKGRSKLFCHQTFSSSVLRVSALAFFSAKEVIFHANFLKEYDSL